MPVPALAHGGGCAEGDALLADFYGIGLSPDVATARAEALLRKHPACALAHEVAAEAALLRDDDELAAAHFLAAASDLDADAVEYYVWHLAEAPHNQAAATAKVLDALRLHHPVAGVRALASMRLARLREREGRFDDAARLAASLVPISAWQVLGSLDNDQGKGFFTDLTPEQTPSVAILHDTKIAGPLVPLRWRKVEHLSRLGQVPLEDLLWPREFALAYLATWVRVDKATTAQLRITSSAPSRIFVNDALVLSAEQVAGAELDNLVAPVTLAAGWNQILVQSAHRHGSWRVLARMTDERGAPLIGARFVDQPQAYPKAEKSATVEVAPREFRGPDGRRQYLASRMSMRDGRSQRALAHIQPFADANPDNPLGMLWSAIAYSENEQLGRTIDLLDRGVQRFGDRAAAFYERRGRYYMQKTLWEKAQTDLFAAAKAAPASRVVSTQIAELFERRGWNADRCRQVETTLQRFPDDVRMLREHGDCLDALGYVDRADAEYERALTVSPGDNDAMSKRLKLASRRGDLRRARQRVASMQRLDPTDPEWLVQEGILRQRGGDEVGARGRFEAAAHIAPERPGAWEWLGQLAYEQGHREAALTAWKRARELAPNDSALAQHVEYLEPLKLGYIDKLVPGEIEIDRALHHTVKPFPNAQQIVLLDHEVTEINADGSARRVSTEVNVAVDDKGRDAMMRVQVPSVGAVKILRAYSIGEKGEQIAASSIRTGEIRFRNLVVGSKTVVQYIHYAPAPHFLPGSFVGTWYFQSPGHQNEDSTWILVMARGRKLHVQLNGTAEQSTKIDGDRELRMFHSTHLQPVPQEAHMPPAFDLAARVEVSTVDSWDDYVRWERALLADAFHSNPALEALGERLVKDANTPREKLDRLFHHVAQEIRYQQDYETTIAGVRPHGAPSVIERGYGDCKDKAVLLIQMARRIGLKLSFAILRTTPHGKVAREVPNQQFDHAIVYVPTQPGIEQPFFMDPTSDGLDMGNVRVDDQGATSLVLDPDSGAWSFIQIPYQTPELQYDRHKIRLDVKSPTEALLSDQMSLRGVSAMGLRHVLRNEGQAAQVYAAIAASLFSGATVRKAESGSKEDIWHPLLLSLDLDASQSLRPEDEHYRLTIPGKFELAPTIALKTRDTPMLLGPPDSSSYDIDAQLPEGFRVTHAPRDFIVNHPCFTLSRRAKVDPGKVNVRIDYVRRCAELPVADYIEFRKSVQEANRKLEDDLLFAKIELPPKSSPKSRKIAR